MKHELRGGLVVFVMAFVLSLWGLPGYVHGADGGQPQPKPISKIIPRLPEFSLECSCTCKMPGPIDAVLTESCRIWVHPCNVFDFKIITSYFDLVQGRMVTQEIPSANFKRALEGSGCSVEIGNILAKNSTGITAEFVCVDSPGHSCKDAAPVLIGALKKEWRRENSSGCIKLRIADTSENREMICANY